MPVTAHVAAEVATDATCDTLSRRARRAQPEPFPGQRLSAPRGIPPHGAGRDSIRDPVGGAGEAVAATFERAERDPTVGEPR